MTEPERVTIHHGDCLDVLRELPDASVDAVVTDPPYSLSFMGKSWDAHENPRAFGAWCELWARECLRVLRPGGHMLAFGGTRTWHRLAVAVEDAGFEIRDSIAWLYGSGFPKSLDVSKAINKAAGAERAIVGLHPSPAVPRVGTFNASFGEATITAPATPDAERWQGWGTALKPAFEPIVVARKPLVGTVAANVLAHGTGGLNVDGCRIEGGARPLIASTPKGGEYAGVFREGSSNAGSTTAGRWPANVILDEDQAEALDEQSGTVGGNGGGISGVSEGYHGGIPAGGNASERSKGGASRFLYVAKADASERPAYYRSDCECEGPQPEAIPTVRQEGEPCPTCGAGTRRVAHPTVKPLDLMRWLVRLVTPVGGLVLDPFAGTGTTSEACLLEGFRCVTIEQGGEHIPLIRQRVDRQLDPVRHARMTGEDVGLLDVIEPDPDLFNLGG